MMACERLCMEKGRMGTFSLNKLLIVNIIVLDENFSYKKIFKFYFF